MGFILTRIKQSIVSAAEGSDDYNRIGYGDPAGDKVHVEGIGWFERGKGWVKEKTAGARTGLLDFIVEAVGGELERSGHQGGVWEVGNSGVAPSLRHSDGLISVTKNEVGIPPAGTCNYVDVAFSESYTNLYDFASFAFIYGTYATFHISYLPAQDTVRIQAKDTAGADIDLNGKMMGLLLAGAVP